MADTIFYPYAFAQDSLVIALEQLEIDGAAVQLSDIFEPESLSAGLSGRPIEKGLRIVFSVSADTEGLKEVLPKGEALEDDLRVLGVVSIPETRRRIAVETKSQGDRWMGDVTIPATDLAGRVVISPVVVRKASVKSRSTVATRKGERVADGRPLTIDTENRPVPPGGAMDSQWLDFGAPSSPSSLQARKDLAWFVDLSNSERPRLLLNDGFPELRRAMQAPQAIGRAARLRDALAHSVLQPVLMILSVEALKSWASSEEGSVPSWVEKLLHTLAALSADGSPELQLDRWKQLWKEEPSAVFLDVQTAIQRHLGMAATAVHLVKSLEEVPVE